MPIGKIGESEHYTGPLTTTQPQLNTNGNSAKNRKPSQTL